MTHYLRLEMSIAALPEENFRAARALFEQMRQLGAGGSSLSVESPHPGTTLHDGEVLA